MSGFQTSAAPWGCPPRDGRGGWWTLNIRATIQHETKINTHIRNMAPSDVLLSEYLGQAQTWRGRTAWSIVSPCTAWTTVRFRRCPVSAGKVWNWRNTSVCHNSWDVYVSVYQINSRDLWVHNYKPLVAFNKRLFLGYSVSNDHRISGLWIK